MTLRIGTRGSQLALWQANFVLLAVKDAGGPPCEIITITTSGDRLAEAKLGDIGGKRLFVKEIEDALLAGEVDVAVHSAKDMAVQLPDGLALGAVLPREDPRDAIVLPASVHRAEIEFAAVVSQLAGGARIGTSSVRRVAQLTRLMPRAEFQPIRGNLDTRLRKLDAGAVDALILATAGLRRLGLADRISASIPIDACTPAPGQGVIAIEIRDGDARTMGAVARVNDPATWAAYAAERALVARLGGGCQTPIGGVALPIGGELDLYGIVTSLDGAHALRSNGRGPMDRPGELGAQVADDLLSAGAAVVLEEVRRSQASVLKPEA